MNELQQWRKNCWRETLITVRQPRLILNAILFFVMMIILFPLALPPAHDLLRYVAPALVWMSVLLAMLLASERIFQQDYDEGILEQYVISSYSLSLMVSAKLMIHWLFIIIPVVLFLPLMMFLFPLKVSELGVMIGSLILGSPAVLALCAFAAAYGVGVQQRGIFMAVVLLPLVVPIIIFGSGAVLSSMHAEPITAYLALLAALSILAFAFLPFAIAAVIRISLSG